MTYENKYKCEWASNNLKGYIYLDQKGYNGEEATTLKLSSRDAFRISHVFEGYEKYIIGARCEFEIINDQPNYFDLLPLMYATEGEYKVRVEITTSGSEASLFEGYINCDVVSQKYLKRQVIQIVASSYLSKLQYLIPTKIEDLQKLSFIDVIDEILRQTGSEFNIRVNSTLYANDDILSTGQTLFNKNGFYTEIFWENNIDRKNSLEILESILTTFNCYLYYFDEKWYIERYEDIWAATSIDYIEYTSGSVYDESGTGAVENVSKATGDIHDITFTSKSQTIKVIPGCRLIRVLTNTDDGLLLNLTINDFSNASAISGVVPYPDYRTWEYWDDDDIYLAWVIAGSHNNISNCILRQWWKGGISYLGGNYILDPDNIEWHRGLYTRFQMTVDEDTKLSVKFKFGINIDSLAYDNCLFWDDSPVAGFTGNLNDYSFKFHWYLRHPTGNYFIMYNEETEEWERNSSTEVDALQEVIIKGDNFDKDNMTCEININVPLGDLVADLEGDQDFVLCIATEAIHNSVNYSSGIEVPAQYCWYGDVILTTNATIANDVIEGEYENTDFLDKKEIELDLFDIANKNYKSGVLRGTDYGEETETWTIDGVNYYSLIKWIFINKFRLYNLSKQKIISSVYSSSLLRLFSQYTDSEQSNKKFLLMGLVHYPAMDKYEVQLYEYDNDTEIILNE